MPRSVRRSIVWQLSNMCMAQCGKGLCCNAIDQADSVRAAVAASARGFTGVPYSVADYFALAAARLHIPYPHLKRYVRDSKSMICSQLADASAAEGGWHLFEDGRWHGDVTPGDLYRLYLKQEKTK